jgi:hypothetical protein
MRETLLGVLTLAIFGCWGCGPANSFKGTVGGRGLRVEDAVFYVFPGDDAIPPGIQVLLSDRPGLCADLRAGLQRKNSILLDTTLARLVNDEYVAPGRGPYTISGNTGRIGAAVFLALDANCGSSLPGEAAVAVSGMVTIDELQGTPGGRIEGSFAMTFGQQADEVTGNFSAGWCDLSAQPGSITCE